MEWSTFGVFLAASFILAIIPGPSIIYVLARTVRGGRREGYLSSMGAGVAGLTHTLAAALGISAILATSATAFFVVKWFGAAYLVYLGVSTLLKREPDEDALSPTLPAPRDPFLQGFVNEALNPKTALFFLTFIPQFVNPDGAVFVQVVFLGCVTTFLTTGVDFLVATAASPLNALLTRRRGLRQGQKLASGATLIGLGVYVATER